MESPPQLVGDVVWGKVFWQSMLPEGAVVLRSPDGFCDENSLDWSGLSFHLVPRQDEPSLGTG